MCLTGRSPFSNYCVSSLAAGFRFHLYSMCIPLPRNFNIGCCANEKLLRLIAHRRVRFFTFMFVSTLVLGAGGGSSLNLIQALQSIVILETHRCTSSVFQPLWGTHSWLGVATITGNRVRARGGWPSRNNFLTLFFNSLHDVG